MNVATVGIEATSARIIDRTPSITTGMVGATVLFIFAPDWDAYAKAAVFRYQEREMTVIGIDDVVTIPPEMLTESGEKLLVGVYGVRSDGQAATPTIWVTLGRVQPGVNPANDPGANPALPAWAQIMAMIGQLGALETGEKSSLVAAINDLVRRGGLPPFEEVDEGNLLFVRNGTAQSVALGTGLEVVEIDGIPTLRLMVVPDGGEPEEITVQIVDGELVITSSGGELTVEIQDGELTVAAPADVLSAEIIDGELYVKES